MESSLAVMEGKGRKGQPGYRYESDGGGTVVIAPLSDWGQGLLLQWHLNAM